MSNDRLRLIQGKNDRLCIEVGSILEAMLDRFTASEGDRRDYYQTVMSSDEFNEQLREYLKDGDFWGNEQRRPKDDRDVLSHADATRKVVLEVLDEAAHRLVEAMLQREAALFQRIEHLKECIQKIEAQWPESHKQYRPKLDFLYPNTSLQELEPIAKMLLEQANESEELGR